MSAANLNDTSVEDRLASSRVAILGLGMMGGSLAMALNGHCAQLLGYDIDPGTVHLAQAQQVVEYASVQLDEILLFSDLVILAAPVRQILQLLAELGQFHPEPAVVLDIGSTKRQVMAAMQALPPRFDPLGGHPLCGKAVSALVNAEPGLYQGATFALCRLPRTSERAMQVAGQLIQVIGAKPLWLGAEEHDRWIAFTSHLPYLLANTLAHATPPEAAALVGPGYRSSTRLAASYAPMLMDILATNQDMIMPGLRAFRQALDRLEACLQNEDWPQAEAFLKESTRRYAELARDRSDVTQADGGLL